MANTTIQTVAGQWYRVTYRARGRRKVYAAERFGVAAGTIDGMDVLTAVPFDGPRADGRKDCPACGHHGSRCQEDMANGTTICHTSAAVIQ